MTALVEWLSGLSDGQWTLLLGAECLVIVLAMWGGAALVRRRNRRWAENLTDTCDLPDCCGTREHDYRRDTDLRRMP